MSTKSCLLLLSTLDINIFLLAALLSKGMKLMHALLAPVVLKEKTGFAFQITKYSQTSVPRDLFGGEMMTQLLQIILLRLPS